MLLLLELTFIDDYNLEKVKEIDYVVYAIINNKRIRYEDPPRALKIFTKKCCNCAFTKHYTMPGRHTIEVSEQDRKGLRELKHMIKAGQLFLTYKLV